MRNITTTLFILYPEILATSLKQLIFNPLQLLLFDDITSFLGL